MSDINKKGETMIKSILVAIDDSNTSKSALSVAIDLAKRTSTKIKGLYIEDMLRLLEWQPTELIGAAIGASSGLPMSKPTTEQIEIEKGFIEEAARIKKLFDDSCNKSMVNGSFITKRGKVDELIIQNAKTTDLTVIGRRGKTYPLDSQDPGPVTEALLRKTTRPVLVVPGGGKLTNKILIAYDGSETAQRALYTGAQFATLFSSEVIVVSVSDDIDSGEGPINEAKEFLSPYSLNVSYVVGFGANKPWKEIIRNANNFEAGLIVLGAFGSNKLMELIFGSTTREVLMQATCPVLLCR